MGRAGARAAADPGAGGRGVRPLRDDSPQHLRQCPDRAARHVADARARGPLVRRADVGCRRLRRISGVRADGRPQRGGARARRPAGGGSAVDGDRRAGLLRVARRSETLRAVEHRVRPAAPARAGAAEEAGPEDGRFGACARRPRALDRVMRDHLKSFLEHLRLNENASPHTVRAYDSDLTQYLAFLGTHLGRRVPDLTAADLDHLNARAFLGDLYRRGNAKASAARKLSAMRAFGRYLRREGIVEGDPASLVGTPKREQRIPAHLAVEEMSKLLETPDVSTPLGRRDRAILELFYASGLRLSELVGLDLDDLNVSGRVVRVLVKGRKERIVPFNRTACDALRAWLADRESLRRQNGTKTPVMRGKRTRDPLFLNYQGGRLS